MRWSTHFIVGATAGLILAKYTGMDPLLMGSAGALFGVLPDADIMLDALGIGGHRDAYSHSLGSSMVLGVITAIIVYFFFDFSLKESAYMGTLGFLASFLHVLADALTYSGVKIFWPVSDKRFKGFVRHDNPPANLLIILLCLIFIYELDAIPYDAFKYFI